jgi:ferric-dicitrate binding protein FerR (iron transport regulator)
VPSTPVFVDITGRRARWLRALAVVACLLVLAYLGVLAAGVFGSSVDLSTAVPHASASASASTS